MHTHGNSLNGTIKHKKIYARVRAKKWAVLVSNGAGGAGGGAAQNANAGTKKKRRA